MSGLSIIGTGILPVAGGPRTEVVPVLPVASTVPRYATTVLGVWRFDGDLTDEVQNNDFVESGFANYTYFQKFELLNNTTLARAGLKFESNKTLSISADYLYNNFTLAFWYYSPGAVGYTRHVTTRELEPKVAPIIAKADSTRTSDKTLLQNASFAVCETAYSKTQNMIRVYISSNGSDVSHIVDSYPYDPGLRNVLITFVRNQRRLRIDIDGKTGILHPAPGGSLQQTGSLRINDIAPGYLAHRTQQVDSYMFDLVFSNYASTDNEALKYMRYGYEHISYENLFDTRFSYFGIAYSQPSTISTNQIFVDGDNVFAARSNGEIVKGGRPVWDKEFKYSDSRSVALLNTSETDGDKRVVEPTTSGLIVQGATIRI